MILTLNSAIITGNYRLIVGAQKFPQECDSIMWSPMDYPCTQGPKRDDCDLYCLFDIVNDPQEKKNLVKDEPTIFKEMLNQYNKYEYAGSRISHTRFIAREQRCM